jgi:hypothetical protein
MKHLCITLMLLIWGASAYADEEQQETKPQEVILPTKVPAPFEAEGLIVLPKPQEEQHEESNLVVWL